MFNLKDILSTASNVQKGVKKAAKVYGKAKAGERLEKDERRTAKGLETISKVLKKDKPVSKTPAQIAPRKEGEKKMGLEEYKQKKKYAVPDYFSRLLAAGTPVKGAKEPLQRLFRAGADKLKTPKGYKTQEAIDLLARQKKMGPLQRAHGKAEKAWEGLDSRERKNLISDLLGQKKVKAEKMEEARKRWALTPEQAFRERGTSPIGHDEKSRIMGEGLRQAIGGVGRGYLSGRTIGVSDVLSEKLGIGKELAAMESPYIKRGDEYYDLERVAQKGNQALYLEKAYADVAPAVSTIIGGLAGGAKTYAPIANKIQQGLKKIKGPIGDALARKPVFTTYLVQNPLEELLEAGVRRTTGQKYTFRDFAIGLGTNSLFASMGLSDVKQRAVNENVERAVRNAEEVKGARLRTDEFEDVVLNTRLLGDKTGRDLLEEAGYMFGERRLAYKTGRKGEVPGLTKPAKAEMRELEAEKVVRDRIKEKSKQKSNFVQKIKNFTQNVKTGFFDKAAYVEKLLSGKVKEGVLDKAEAGKFGEAYDRSLRAMKLADKFLKESGFEKAAKRAAKKDIERVGETMKALHKLDIAKQHKMDSAEYKKAFGTSKSQDELVAKELAPKYAKEIKEYQQAVKKLNDYMVESGLASAKGMKILQEAYRNYVPLYRMDFEKMIKGEKGLPTEASLSRQTVLQEFKGSDADIKNPYEAFIDKVAIAFREGEKNKVARTIADYGDIRGFDGIITKLPKGESAPHTIKYFEDGKVKEVAVPKEVEAFAKNAGVVETGAVLNASRWLMRGFKAGTTGVNPAFLLANIPKDFFTAKITSAYGVRMFDVMMGIGSRLRSGVAKTKVGKKLGIKEGKWADEYDTRGGGGMSEQELYKTSKAPKLETYIPVKDMPGKGIKKNVKYITKGFKKIRDGLEKTLAASDDATRLGVLRRNYKGFLGEGYGHEDAMRLAMQEALDATANFVRGGRFKKVISSLYPYRAASFAGARSVQKAFKRAPAKTAFRIAKNILIPEATLVAWNLSDERRRKIYQDIPGWEKDLNFIAVTPWASWNKEEKRWEGVIKLPKPPGLGAFTYPIRREAERALEGGEGASMQDWVTAITGPIAGIDIQDTAGSTFGDYIPHAGKIPLEIWANKKFFTGKDIIPDYLRGDAPKDQYYDWTPDVYAVLGEKLGVSPLVIEHIVGGFAGSAGEQAIGGKDPIKEITKRFYGTYGGAKDEKELQRQAERLFSPKDITIKRTKEFKL